MSAVVSLEPMFLPATSAPAPAAAPAEAAAAAPAFAPAALHFDWSKRCMIMPNPELRDPSPACPNFNSAVVASKILPGKDVKILKIVERISVNETKALKPAAPIVLNVFIADCPKETIDSLFSDINLESLDSCTVKPGKAF